MIKRFVYAFLFFVVLESLFISMALKLYKINKYLFGLILVYSLFTYIFLGVKVFGYDRSIGVNHSFYWALSLFLLQFIPKLILVSFWLLVSLFVIPLQSFSNVVNPSRKLFIGQLGLIISSIPFSGFLYGLIKGKYDFKIFKEKLIFKDLPSAFNGLKILQISDIHSGSFDSPSAIEKAISLINDQDFDLFLFTGDIVNTKAEEMHPWLDMFKKIKEPRYGKFSVLGNHDYGVYIDWPSDKDKLDNFNAIKDLHSKLNFKLLLNDHVKLKNGNDSISLLGVENWGHNFAKLGDLDKALTGVDSGHFKILMSHDPSHWEHVVKDHHSSIHLTLSGHTHGLQMGVEIPGFIKWSPIKYVYKYWAGLYEENERKLYVNRGFGFHGFSGRVGIWPEITVLELLNS